MRSHARPGRIALAAIIAAAVCAGPAVGAAHAAKSTKTNTTTAKPLDSTTTYTATGRKIA